MEKFKAIIQLCLYASLLFIAVVNLPQSVWTHIETRQAMIGIGIIGIWRYGWWFIHLIRSLIYGKIVFPKRRLKADQLWNSGWRPKRIFFMMTTFHEERTTTEKVLETVITECNEIAIPAKFFIGTGSEYDEEIIKNYISLHKTIMPLEVIMVRQGNPGKRSAIAATLRVMKKEELTSEDVAVFLDGDTVMIQGCLRKCLPFFPLYKNMHALTTNETVIVHGPTWMKKWLDMRFAQRHFVMQSHALSNKVLTLTGRMSIFRASHVLNDDFIETIESDHLQHWLWGDFKFLSGDDKSTWYYLLKSGGQMFYIPDAMAYTIEIVKGNGFSRMKENLLRWSGNMLRNGARAMALGPRKIGFFIWWCLVDQRISIWTILIGLLTAIILSFAVTPAFLLVYILWVAFTRMCLSFVLFYYGGRIDISFPFLLYFSQIINSAIKIYLLFRLPRQRWANRGDQQASLNMDTRWKDRAATGLTTFYCTCFFIIVLTYLGIISIPGIADMSTFLS